MNVELRGVSNCPNLPATRELLLACIAELEQPVTVIERVGDYPSPTVLIDGVDVTGAAATEGVGSCRLDLPTADQIRTALRNAVDDGRQAATATLTADCCPPVDPLRTDRPLRAADLPAAARAVHRNILRHFATTGIAPSAGDVAGYARGAGIDQAAAIRDLAERDLIAVDDTGEMTAAYPFSPTVTEHQVTLGSITVSAMCAIDALGIPAMLHTNAVIRSRDAHTGAPITVAITDGVATFEPASTVVVYATTGRDGPSVDSCCSTINFFTDIGTADAWIAAHPRLQSRTLSQADAIALGSRIFGPLIDDECQADSASQARDA